MATPTIATILKMIEDLPEPLQKQIADHLREYIADLEDEEKWDALFSGSQENLAQATRDAARQIAEGKAQPMDLGRL
jgi:hypothetical protein